jgi:hypothetical protein
MVVFLIHRSRAKAGALSVGHTLSLRPKLGKVVNRDTQIQSQPFASSPPLHASFCINYHLLILFLHPGTLPDTIPSPDSLSGPTGNMLCST